MRKSRLLVGALAALAVAVAFFGAYRLMNSGPKLAADTPVLFQWEDYVDQPFLADYRSRYGETPQTAIYADEDEAFAKLRAG